MQYSHYTQKGSVPQAEGSDMRHYLQAYFAVFLFSLSFQMTEKKFISLEAWIPPVVSIWNKTHLYFLQVVAM
jgi:hypothetical protein